MVPTVDPATVVEVDERMRHQADEVSREGADLARSLGLDAEPLSAADAGDVARTILEVARGARTRRQSWMGSRAA